MLIATGGISSRQILAHGRQQRLAAQSPNHHEDGHHQLDRQLQDCRARCRRRGVALGGTLFGRSYW